MKKEEKTKKDEIYISEIDNKTNNNRWWEFYLVRYFVGSVVGMLIVLILCYSENRYISKLVKGIIPGSVGDNFEMSYLWLFGFVGLAFCYIASAPVLVLHALRASIFGKGRASQKRLKSRYLLILPLFLPLCAVFLAYWTNQNVEIRWESFDWWLILVIFIVQFTLYTLLIIRWNLYTFYNNLAAERDKIEKQSSFVESYKHLREHGNAFLIVVMEIMLGIVLFYAENGLDITTIMILWGSPAAFVWFIGSYLESKVANQS